MPEDRRKYNGGNKNAGRKSKAEEMGLPKLIEDVIGEKGKKELIGKIYAQATKDCRPSQKLLMEYIYGKPLQQTEISGRDGEPFEGFRLVKADAKRPENK